MTPFMVNAVGSALVACVLFVLRRRLPAEAPVRDDADRRSLLRDAVGGVTTVWRMPILRLLALSAVGINTLFATLLATQVLFVQKVLDLGSVGFALMLAAAAVGAVVGSQLAAGVVARWGNTVVLTGSLTAMGASYLMVVVMPVVWVVAGVYTVVAALVAMYAVASVSIRQRIVPAALLGRVNATLRLATWGMSTIGLVLGGIGVELLRRRLSDEAALTAPYAVSYLVIGLLLIGPVRKALQRIDRTGGTVTGATPAARRRGGP